MAIKNTLLGGTDWTDGQVLYSEDLNDTFDAAATEIEKKIEYTKIWEFTVPAQTGASSYVINTSATPRPTMDFTNKNYVVRITYPSTTQAYVSNIALFSSAGGKVRFDNADVSTFIQSFSNQLLFTQRAQTSVNFLHCKPFVHLDDRHAYFINNFISNSEDSIRIGYTGAVSYEEFIVTLYEVIF